MNADLAQRAVSLIIQRRDAAHSGKVRDGRYPRSIIIGNDGVQESRIESLSDNLSERNKNKNIHQVQILTSVLGEYIMHVDEQIEVLEKAQAVAPNLGEDLEIEIMRKIEKVEYLKTLQAAAPYATEDLELEIRRKEAEVLWLKLELSKAMLAEKITQIEDLKMELQGLASKLGEKNLEVEDLRRKAEAPKCGCEVTQCVTFGKKQRTE
ncbi:unnamed protein product [Calypogeia fissa]